MYSCPIRQVLVRCWLDTSDNYVKGGFVTSLKAKAVLGKVWFMKEAIKFPIEVRVLLFVRSEYWCSASWKS